MKSINQIIYNQKLEIHGFTINTFIVMTNYINIF